RSFRQSCRPASPRSAPPSDEDIANDYRHELAISDALIRQRTPPRRAGPQERAARAVTRRHAWTDRQPNVLSAFTHLLAKDAASLMGAARAGRPRGGGGGARRIA